MSEPLDLEAIRERAERAMDAPGIPLTIEVADLIGLVVPALIEEVERLRAEHEPRDIADAVVDTIAAAFPDLPVQRFDPSAGRSR